MFHRASNRRCSVSVLLTGLQRSLRSALVGAHPAGVQTEYIQVRLVLPGIPDRLGDHVERRLQLCFIFLCVYKAYLGIHGFVVVDARDIDSRRREALAGFKKSRRCGSAWSRRSFSS